MVIARSRGVFLGVRYVLRMCMYVCVCVSICIVYACNGCVPCLCVRVYLHCLSYSLRFVEYVSTV